MTDKEKRSRDLEIRIKKLSSRPTASKTPGVLNALKSELKKLKNTV